LDEFPPIDKEETVFLSVTVAQISVGCIADFQSAGVATFQELSTIPESCRLEALRYSRLEICATVTDS